MLIGRFQEQFKLKSWWQLCRFDWHTLLPNHPDFGADKKYKSENLPKRLAENLKSSYAVLYDWTDDRVKLQKWIEDAFKNTK